LGGEGQQLHIKGEVLASKLPVGGQRQGDRQAQEVEKQAGRQAGR
jgi:hypothetical protein